MADDAIKAFQAANHDRGVMLDNARRFGLQFAGTKGTKTEEAAVRTSTKVWNGDSQPPTNTKVLPCVYFNNGKAHSLDTFA